MAFFKTEPNVPDAEKARLEFHLQQIADCIGFDRFELPFLNKGKLLGLYQANKTPEQILAFVGDHLKHDVDGLRLVVAPKQLEKCGGGG